MKEREPLFASQACPSCGTPGAKGITHVCMFAGLPYEHQPRSAAVGYQTCPKCGGQGFVAKPPWVAGDQHSWPATDTGNHSCPVCSGAKLIVGPNG